MLDQDQWLDREQRSQLESELTRLRQTHAVDVLVIIWSQAFDSETDPEQLARRLGATWSREDLWALVLHRPDATTHPLAVWGGPLLEDSADSSLDKPLRDALARGLKEWTGRDRVSGVALNLGEELVFLQSRRRAELAARQQQQTSARAEAGHPGWTGIIRYALIAVAVLIAIALVATGWILYRSRPTSLRFPKTRWRRRLGANWSGGSNLITSFTPPEKK